MQVFQLQRQILKIGVQVALGLLAECTEQSGPHPFTLRVVDKVWDAGELENIIMTFHNSQEARSKGFWKREGAERSVPLGASSVGLLECSS